MSYGFDFSDFSIKIPTICVHNGMSNNSVDPVGVKPFSHNENVVLMATHITTKFSHNVHLYFFLHSYNSTRAILHFFS